MHDNLGEHAEGKYNFSHSGTIHSVGIGEANNNKNAFEIMDDGRIFIYGIGGYDDTNADEADDLATVLGNLQ